MDLHGSGDPLRSLNDLLRQCIVDFDEIYSFHNSWQKSLENSLVNQCSQVYLNATNHLNGIVTLSSRVFFQLQSADSNLRQSTLTAVYRVVSLALWCSQRAIRCAGLRCLRYYVRCKEDIDILLENRLDLFISRCLDLSYADEFLAPLCVANGNDSSSTLDEWASKNSRIQHLAGPYRRFLDDLKRGGRDLGFQRPFYKSSAPTSANDVTERMAVLRLAGHLLRFSEGAFTVDLVHSLAAAVSATCTSTALPIGIQPPHPASPKAREVVGPPPPQTLFSPLAAQFNSGRERDSCSRAYLLLLTEFVMRNSETKPLSDSPAMVVSRSSPLEVAVKALIGALPCSGEPGEIYKHPAVLLETILLALLRLSAESSHGRRVVDSWIFQKCVAPYLVTYPMVTVPRSPYDSNPSFIAATRDSFVYILRSWPGLFYFLRDGQNCLHALMQSLLLGSSKLRAQVLSMLYNLFPGVPAPAPFIPTTDTAHAVMDDFSSALYTGLPYPPMAYRGRGRQENQSQSQKSVAECLPPFPYLDGDFVVEEGLRLYPFFQPAGTDILEAHSALVLSCLVQAGLFEALIAAVDDPSLYVAAAAGQLLGVLAFRANTQLHPDSLCVERFSRIPLLGDRFRAIDFMDRFNQTLTERIYIGSRPKLRAPLVSPFFECLSHQPVIPCPALSSPTCRTGGTGVAKFSDSGGFASLIRKTSRATLPTQYSDNLLERVVNCSSVCSAPTNVNNATIHTGTSITSGAAKSISHFSQVSYSSGVFSNGILLSSSMTSPYEWDWESLASWGRRLSSSGSVLFSWNDQTSQNFLTRLMDFITPNIDVITLPMDIAYPSGSSPLYPILLKPSGNSQEDSFPLSPAYVRLLNRRTISNTISPSTSVLQNLSWTNRNWSQSWAAAILISGLLPHLSLYPQNSFPGSLLRRFLAAVRTCLVAATTPSSSPVISCAHLLFQPSHLREHCSSFLLLGLGRLLSCETGSTLLHSMDIPDLLITLSVGQPIRDPQSLKQPDSLTAVRKQRLLCAKFLLSSMNYTGSGFGRSLLATICSTGHVALRLWVTKFIRLLIRLNLPFVEIWLVPLLLNLTADRNVRVMHEAISVLEEACLNPPYLQSLLDCMQTENRQGTGKRCCSAFPSHILRFLSIGTLSSQRVVAFLLAKSAWMFKIASTPKLFNSQQSGNSVYPRGTIEGTLLEIILRDWMEFYNERFAKNIESSLQDAFRIPLSPHCGSSPSLDHHTKFFQRCPACNQPANFSDLDRPPPPEGDNTADDAEEDNLFLNRQSNRLFFSHLGDGGDNGLQEDEIVELSPVAIQLFYQNRASLYVPLHLFYCLSMQEAGFCILRDNGYLATLTNVLSQSRNLVANMEGKGQPGVAQVKAAIWALASVLVTPNGIMWKQAPTVLKDIFWNIANADSLSLRGVAWLSVCYISSTPSGSTLLRPWILGDGESGSGESTGTNWLLSTTDRVNHIWSLRERPVLQLRVALPSEQDESGGGNGLSPTPSNRSSGQGRSSMSVNLSFLSQADPHRHSRNMFCLGDSIDPDSLSPGAFSGTIPTTAASPSAHSPSSPSITDSRSSRPVDQLLRPVCWIARRAGVTFRGGGRGGGNGRNTVEIDPNAQPEIEDVVDSVETAMIRVERERTVSVTALPGRISVQPTSFSAMVQSLSSPGCFSAFDSVADSKSASASPIGTPIGATVNAPSSGLTDIFVFRGLFLPADVSNLGRHFFPNEVAQIPKSSVPVVNGNSTKPTNGGMANGETDEKLTIETSIDNTQRLCISAACRNGEFVCPQTSEDAKIESWRHDVVEEVENLMNGLLSGRVLGNMLTLTHQAVAFTIISNEENSEKEQLERRCNFSSACLHAEVARILFNYRYSRPARTLVQLFLGQFPPANELLNDAETALEDFCESASLTSSHDPSTE
ncbi:unnamed protein product [Hymenolepis diminuta]|uniref:Rapamycin-insensitive companion of mTOR domain-containing protein n=1 Tax=Hymenolepis diminuta TaxID=6216 RepID=A0A564Y8C3_HYMDI|nr:unnamed protein product [Hymenolepis diminuta]